MIHGYMEMVLPHDIVRYKWRVTHWETPRIQLTLPSAN
jgi:hypothetical protein